MHKSGPLANMFRGWERDGLGVGGWVLVSLVGLFRFALGSEVFAWRVEVGLGLGFGFESEEERALRRGGPPRV